MFGSLRCIVAYVTGAFRRKKNRKSCELSRANEKSSFRRKFRKSKKQRENLKQNDNIEHFEAKIVETMGKVNKKYYHRGESCEKCNKIGHTLRLVSFIDISH